MLHRLLHHLSDRVLLELQAGFQQRCSRVDNIFIAWQLLEKAREHQKEISFAFIDLRKAFDTVNHDLLWKVLEKFACPPKYLTMIRQFHDGMTAIALINGEASTPFDITVGVKQGCVHTPTFFNLYLVAITLLSRNGLDVDNGVHLHYRWMVVSSIFGDSQPIPRPPLLLFVNCNMLTMQLSSPSIRKASRGLWSLPSKPTTGWD